MDQRLSIRNVKYETYAHLMDIAKSQNKTVSELVREILDNYCLNPELRQVEDKYATLVEVVAEVVGKNTVILNEVLEKMENKNECRENDI